MCGCYLLIGTGYFGDRSRLSIALGRGVPEGGKRRLSADRRAGW